MWSNCLKNWPVKQKMKDKEENKKMSFECVNEIYQCHG